MFQLLDVHQHTHLQINMDSQNPWDWYSEHGLPQGEFQGLWLRLSAGPGVPCGPEGYVVRAQRTTAVVGLATASGALGGLVAERTFSSASGGAAGEPPRLVPQ